MQHLLAGYERFRNNYWPARQATFADLARRGQAPLSMVVACCDSRVPPEIVFDCAPGEIFVVRSIANLVPPYAPDAANHGTSAALEFAVRRLRVRNLIVLGHSGCGGIEALLGRTEGGEKTDFIDTWMAIASEAARRARAAVPHHHADPKALCAACERENIRVSLANLAGFPWIAERVAAGDLTVAGFHFDVETGSLAPVA